MKKTILILMMSVLVLSCKKNLTDLTEGMMFSLDMNAYLQNQVQVQIINANFQNSTTVPSAKISIQGKDANKVFDINGSKSIVVENQFANLVVSPGNPIKEGNPAFFTIKAEAPGFLNYEKEITISHVDSFMNFTIEMIEIAKPIEGISIANKTNNFSGSQPAAQISSNNNKLNSTLFIPANTKLVDDAGNTFTGNAVVQIEQFDPSAEPVKENIQNLIPHFSTNTFNNGIAEDFYFAPLGYLRVNVDNNSGRKIQMDQTATLEVVFNAQAVDPVSGEPLSAGDVLMVYQKDRINLRWNLVEQTQLFNGPAGSLKADVRFYGTEEIAFSRKRGDDKNETRNKNCTNSLGIQFKRNSSVNTLHYVAVVNANNPNQVYLNASNVVVANNTTYNFTGKLPQDVNVKVLVYQYELSTDKGIIVGETAPFKSCSYSTNNRVEVTVNPPIKTNYPIARFQLYTICEEQRLIYLHEGRIQFRLAGTRRPFRDLGLALRTTENPIDSRSTLRVRSTDNSWNPGTFNYSYLETDRMVNNTVYEFKTEIIGKRDTDGKTIRKTYTRNRIFNLNEFIVGPKNSNLNYDYFIMNRNYWIAPEEACDDFGY